MIVSLAKRIPESRQECGKASRNYGERYSLCDSLLKTLFIRGKISPSPGAGWAMNYDGALQAGPFMAGLWRVARERIGAKGRLVYRMPRWLTKPIHTRDETDRYTTCFGQEV
jgi:hypothetical protein